MNTGVFASAALACLAVIWLVTPAFGDNPYAVEVPGTSTGYYTEKNDAPSTGVSSASGCSDNDGCPDNGAVSASVEPSQSPPESAPMAVPEPVSSSASSAPTEPASLLPELSEEEIRFPSAKESLRSTLRGECGNGGPILLCEDRVVANLLQTRILNNDVEGIADLLKEATGLAGIVGGLRIPQGFDFQKTTELRNVDPDVAAIKGLALAVIDGTNADTAEGPANNATVGMGLINKLVNAIVIASQPPRDATFNCDLDLRPMYSFENGVTISESANCTTNVTAGPVDPGKLREALLDINLMAEIIDADAGLEDRRRLLMAPLLAKGRRALRCASCINPWGYICSNCWKSSFCALFEGCT